MKGKILNELNRLKSKLENCNTEKSKELLYVVENAIKDCDILECDIDLEELYNHFFIQYRIIQSKPIPKYPKGGVIAKINFEYPILDNEIVEIKNPI